MAEETKIKEDTVTVPVAQGDLDAVSNAEFYNPHGVLGGHLGIGKHADTATIRVLRPLAKSVTILTQDGEYPMTHEYNGVFVVTVPASGTKKQPTIPDYRVRTEWESGAVLIEDDPYRYMPTVGDMDTYLFGEGRHEKLWETLGAHVLRYDDPMGGADGTPGEQVVGTAFSVWAPNAHAVRVVGNFNAWDGRRHAMRELGSSGVWEIFIPGIGAGETYKFQILNANYTWEMKADPMERQHEVPPNTASIVTESTYKWNDDAWMQHRRTTNPHDGPVSIYEVHAGSWRQGLTYRDLAKQLVDYVKQEGFTHVEFMPLARLAAVIQVQHRGDRVHAQRVDMVLVQPEAGVGHQEVAHFAASEIEHIGAPIRMLATGRVRILVQRRAIESAKGERVLREMRRNPVHDYADAGLVHLLDEILEVVRAAKARINRVIAGYLITPRAGEGMLGQRHEFHMGETFLLDVGDQLVGQFAIVLHILAPARGMDLVDADRTVVRVGLGSLVHPVLVMPRMDGVDDDGTGARRNLMRTLHRIGLHDPFVVGVEDLILVNRSRFDTRNE